MTARISFLSRTLSAATIVGTLLSASFVSAAESPFKVLSFVAKAKVALSNGTKEPTATFDAVYTVRGDMLKVEATDPVNKTTINTIQRGGTIYYWANGDATGTKLPADSKPAQSSANFYDISRCIGTAGRQVGNETIDGVATTKWTYAACGKQRDTVTIWLTKQGSPKKMENRTPEGAMNTVTFTSVEPKEMTDSPFNPPAKMAFITPQGLLPTTPSSSGPRPGQPGSAKMAPPAPSATGSR